MRSGVVLAPLLLMGIARFSCASFGVAGGLDAGGASGDAATDDAASGDAASADAAGSFCSNRPAGTVFCAEFDDVRSLDAGWSPSTGPGGTLVVDAGVLLASTLAGGSGAYLFYQFSPTANHVQIEALVRAVRIGDAPVLPIGFNNEGDTTSYRELALYIRRLGAPFIQYLDHQTNLLREYPLPTNDISQSHRYAIDLRFLDDGGAPLFAVSVDGETAISSGPLASPWARGPLGVQVGVNSNAKDCALEVDNVLITAE